MSVCAFCYEVGNEELQVEKAVVSSPRVWWEWKMDWRKNWVVGVWEWKEGQKRFLNLSAGYTWAWFPRPSAGFSNPTTHGYREILRDWPGNPWQPLDPSMQCWNVPPARRSKALRTCPTVSAASDLVYSGLFIERESTGCSTSVNPNFRNGVSIAAANTRTYGPSAAMASSSICSYASLDREACGWGQLPA